MAHLVLVGLMGAGKTTVGRIIAERLGRPLVDSDQVIERQTGRNVREIFERDGEAAFRVLETAAIRDALAAEAPSVIAAAGGVVLDAGNRAALRAADAVVVWLHADPAALVERAVAGAHRPLLDDDPVGALQRMSDERVELYREVADEIVPVTGRTVDEVVDAVLRLVDVGTVDGR